MNAQVAERQSFQGPAQPASSPGVQDLVVVLRAEDFGGSERHTVDLVNYLTAAGWHLTLILPGLDLTARGIHAAPEHLTILRTELPLTGLSRADARAWRQLFRTLPARTALLIKPWYYAADPRFLRALRAGYSRVVHLEHSLVPERLPFRVRLHFGVLPGLGLWWFRDLWRRRQMSRTADRVLAVSEACRAGLVQDGLIRSDKVIACPNGVNLEQWARDPQAGRLFRARLGLDADVYLFGTVSHLVPIKGIDLALRALAGLVELGHRQVAYCVIGDGPLRQDLEKLAEQLGVRDRVYFLGHLQDVRPAYSALDTLLCPSTTESFGLACLEAMACGCRVIAAAVGGLPEAVTDPVCGELLHDREPDNWAGAMARHMKTPAAECSQLADQIRAHVARVHDQRARLAFLAAALVER